MANHKKNVLIIGSGGREHALGWKLAQSPHVGTVYFAPGNAGTLKETGGINPGGCINLIFDGTNPEQFSKIAEMIPFKNIDLTIIGPEAPLSKGLVNYLHSEGHTRVIGPTLEAAMLESDKFFSYDILRTLGIAQATSIACETDKDAIRAITSLCTSTGVVLKTPGLAAGKGVVVCDSIEKALEERIQLMRAYGSRMLVCERLFGEEFSVFGISDGKTVKAFPYCVQDHKRLLDGDCGPNTGGMGAYAPAMTFRPDLSALVCERVMKPVIEHMNEIGRQYKGFLYAGMIMTAQGPKVLEFNVRFGDPECQASMMLLKSDLYETLSLATEGRVDEMNLDARPGSALSVVLAAPGYPGSPQKGGVIHGLDLYGGLHGTRDVKVFHAGTRNDDSRFLVNGGRVLSVTAYDAGGIVDARARAYEAVGKITAENGLLLRSDIGSREIERVTTKYELPTD